MANTFRSIFKGADKTSVPAPVREKPVMRVLEPRILLDAAAIETAVDVASQAAHNQFADDFIANTRSTADIDLPEPVGESTAEAMAEMQDDISDFSGTDARRTDREIVFIDAGVENRADLIASLEPGVTIYVLEAETDGVLQMASVLSGPQRYDAIHIFSHGDVGELHLGNATLDADSIDGEHSDALRTIGAALGDEGDILLYGCNFGQGSDGVDVANALAAATGADIAASDDLTGSESLSGDWDLEVTSGQVESRAFRMVDWEGVLGDYQLQAVSDPVISHASNGIIGTTGTIARWSNAVSYDPGGGMPIEFYDLRATIDSTVGQATASFETVSTVNPTLDDFRVVVTNLGAVEQTIGLEDVLEEGTVTVLWEILNPGLSTRPANRSIDIAISDIDGLAGMPDTREAVGIRTTGMSSYTFENPSELDVNVVNGTVRASGTQNAVDAPGAKFGAAFGNTTQFVIDYTTRTQTAEFDLDGDGDITFASPDVTETLTLDLDADDSSTVAGQYTTVYVNGDPTGATPDVPVSIADADLTVFDIDSTQLSGATITLTNASAGDTLNFDNTFLGSLGIVATQDLSIPSQITVTLTGRTPLNHYMAAVQSITYSNVNPDIAFDMVTPRVISTTITDGRINSTPIETAITFAPPGAAPRAEPDFYTTDEDVTLNVPLGSGLLANDDDFQSDPLSITSAAASSGAALTIGAGGNIIPGKGNLTLNSDGSFTFVPLAQFSGSETITYTVSDGANTTTSYAVITVRPVVDDVVLTITQNNPASDEDAPSNPIDVAFFTPDPSEVQEVYAEIIPEGVVITDGVNSFTATAFNDEVEITNWDLTQIRVLPIQNSDQDISFDIVVYNSEIDDSEMDAIETVTFQIDAVADEPLVIAEQGGGAVDAEVDLSGKISITLFDVDGSETLTDITLGNIPVGGEILVNGLIVPQTGNAVTLTLPDLADIRFRPPITGAAVIYNLEVFGTTTETSPENGVSVASATRGPIILVIDLNNNDDPVFPVNDNVTAFSGGTVTIDVLDNDFIPDGGGFVNAIDGQPLIFGTPVVLANGAGTVALNVVGSLDYTATANFSGTFSFTYTVEDSNGSTADALVNVTVEPRWNVAGPAGVVEGDNVRYNITIDGAVRQGSSISVDVSAINVDTTFADYGSLDTAITDSIVNLGQFDFSYAGGTLTFTAPEQNYTPDFQPGANTFTDISGTGTPLGLGDEGVAQVALGFDFDFYANQYNEIFISANGFVTFGSPFSGAVNGALDGTAFGGRPGIAALWDDLNATAGEVYSQVNGAPGSRIAIVQWDQVTNNGGGAGNGSFQMTLNEATGDIRFNYQDVDFGGAGTNGATATIGVQGASGINDQFSLNTASVSDGASLVLARGASLSPTFAFDLPIVDDPNFELAEDFRIRINNAVGSSIGQTSVTTTIGLSDNTDPVAADDAVTTTESTVAAINVITDAPGQDTDIDPQTLTISQINGVNITDGQIITLASGAQITVNFNGNIVYNPSGAFDGMQVGQMTVDSFTYTISDGFGGTDTATVNVTIDGENSTPIIDLNDDGTTPARDISVLYPPAAPATAIADANASVLDPDDSSFTTLTLTLGNFLQASQEVLTIVAPVPDVVMTFGAPLTTTFNVGGPNIDLVYDGANLITMTDTGGGEISRADMEAILRSITYLNTSGADQAGIRTVDIATNDGVVASNVARSSITVVGINQSPVAQDDGTPVALAATEDIPLTITEASLLANDSDGDGDPLNIISVQGAVNGTVVQDGLGNVIFTPALNYSGPASFTYTVGDGLGGMDTATVFIDVTAVNDVPVVDLNGIGGGIDHTIGFTENGPLTPIVTLDAMVIDPDDSTLVDLVITLTNGQVGDIVDVGTMPPGVSANVVPANAATGLTVAGPVTVTLTGAGTPTDFQTALRGIRFGNNSETPNETARIVQVVGRDAASSSTLATTTINVTAVNDNPVANADGPLMVPEDGSRTFAPVELTGNDTDADGDTLTIQSVQSPTNGSVVIDGGGNVLFTPTPGFSGGASFTYTIIDGNGGSDTATVSLTITGVNDAPVVDLDTGAAGTGYSATYIENGAGISVVDASINITDVDDVNLELASVVLTNGQIGDVLEVGALPGGIAAVIAPPTPLTAAGTITVWMSGSATIADYEAALQLVTFRSISEAPSTVNRIVQVAVNDGDINSPTTIATIAVTAVNDAPVAVDDGPFAMTEDTPRTFTPAELLGNDSDVEGDTLTIQSVQGAVGGTVILDGSGNVVFTPTANLSGPASFTYTVSDGNGGTDVATVSIDVAAANDAPVVDLDATAAGSGYATTYTENAPAIPVVDATIDITDIDNPTLASAVVTLTNGRVGDFMEIVAGSVPVGITASVAPNMALTADGTISVTFVGVANIADYETALRAIRFSSVSEAPSTLNRAISVIVSDGVFNSVPATTTISVVEVNDIPVANPDGPFAMTEDTPRAFIPADLVGNDTDADGDTLTIQSVQGAVNGTVALNGAGNVVFTPLAGFNGAASFTYTVSDGNGGTAVGTATINITGTNDLPIVDLDTIAPGVGFNTTYAEGGPGVPVVSANIDIVDIDDVNMESAAVVLTNGQIGDVLEVGALPGGIVAVVAPPTPLTAAGTITVWMSGSATIADYEAALQLVTFRSISEAPSTVNRIVQVAVNDGDINSPTTIATIAVTAVNDAPVAVDDGPFAMTEDTPRTFTPAELLGNDSDVEGDTLTIQSVQGAVGGTVILDGSGNVVFTPTANLSGPATFTYTVSDGNGGTDVAMVTLNIAAVNDLPVVDLDTGTAGSDYAATYTENGTGIAVTDASIDISDVDNTSISAATVTLTNGRAGDLLAVNAGALPPGIAVTIAPPTALTASGTILVTLTGSAPLADYEAALQLVLFSSTSEDPDTIDRSFLVAVSDGAGSGMANSTISVVAVNDIPVANPDGPFAMTEDTPRTFTPAELVGNDTDADGDTLTIQSVQGAVNGTVALNGAGNVVFTPNVDFAGAASFTYTIDDGNGGTATGTATINVAAVNDAPVTDLDAGTAGSNYAVTYTENAPAIPVVDVTIDILDVDSATLASAVVTLTDGRIGDLMEVVAGSLPAGITASVVPNVALTADGTISVTLLGVASLADYETALRALTFRSVSEAPSTLDRNISVIVSDGALNSIPATTTISVVEVNDAPVAAADGAFDTNEDIMLVLSPASLLGNDVDVDGDTLTIQSVQGAINGTVTLNGSGNVEFMPAANYFGPASFTYTVDDGRGGTDTATVTINVIGVNDAPVVDLNGLTAGEDYNTGYTENAPAIAIVDGAVTVFDEEGTDIVSATVVLTNGQIDDLVQIGTLPAGITATVTPPTALTVPGTVTVTLTGTAAGTVYQAALQAISYSSLSENPDVTDRVITVQVSEGALDSNVATTTIAITRVNDAPVGVDDGVPTPIAAVEDTPVTITPLTNDLDIDGDALTITEIEGISITPGGTVTIAGAVYELAADGATLTYTPPLNFNGPTSFVYTLSDGVLTSTATVSLDVAPVNDAPVATDDGPLVLAEDTVLTFDPVSGNDIDVDGNPLTVSAINGAAISAGATVAIANGTITLNPDGRTMTFAPTLNFNGPASFDYTVTDGLLTDDATVTFDITPVNDATVVTGAAPDVTFNDADPVTIAMAGFFDDVDGDALTYGALNLPLGLSIDPATGVLSGTIDGSASLTSPYTITITATDTLSPVVSFDFTMTVLNVAPVVVSMPNVPLDDGSTFSYDVNPLFLDVDGDTLNFTGAGLPAWASLDGSTGLVSGTVPTDASTLGPVAFTVTADDGEGGTVTTNVTFDPQNVPPVVTTPAPDIAVPEQAEVTIDVTSYFADGGSDNDPLTFAVAGLPDGLSFDPATNLITGETAEGSGSGTPYQVVITVDDGQGGVVTDTFLIRVGDFSFEDDRPLFDDREGSFGQGFNFDNEDQNIDGSLGQVLNTIEDLDSTRQLDGGNGIVISAVSDIDPLNSATLAGSGFSEIPASQNDVIDAFSQSTDWLTSSGRIGKGGWDLDLQSNYLAADFSDLDVGSDGLLEKIEVKVFREKNAIYIETINHFDPLVDGSVERTTLTNLDGRPLPGWMKIIRSGFISVNPPADLATVDLRIVIRMTNGEELVKTVNINLKDAVAVETAPRPVAKAVIDQSLAGDHHPKMTPELAERIRKDAV